MPKRTHLLDKDVETFFNDEYWATTLNKRVLNWKTVTTSEEPRLFSMILAHRNNKMSLEQVMEKLENNGYNFSSRDYFPYCRLNGELNIQEANNYIHLYTTLKNKGIVLSEIEKTTLSKFFNQTFSKKLYEFFASENIEPSWTIITKSVFSLGTESGDFFTFNMDEKLLNFFSNLLKQETNNQIDFDNDIAWESNVLDEKITFIINYLNTHNITSEQQKELFENIFSPQHRLEKYMYHQNPSFNFIEMRQVYRETISKPYEWFTDHQITLIEYLEQHFNLVFLEKKSIIVKNKL